MAEQIKFGRSDCEKAIVRVLDSKKNCVGTGFLIAPGYVLTCAHVVLQATGVSSKYEEYVNQPGDIISLDFPLQRPFPYDCEAKVVEWLPYETLQNDVALLKLLKSEPSDAVPLPVAEYSPSSISEDTHYVYGFGSPQGKCSEAYKIRPNSVLASRFQLCKSADPDDETIKPGYSGGPVWNEKYGCIVGMIATVNEAQQEAYAISKVSIATLLSRLQARWLQEELIKLKNSCKNDSEKARLQHAIADTLERCYPNADLDNRATEGDRLIFDQLRRLDSDSLLLEQLTRLSVEYPAAIGWEVGGNLIRVAVQVAQTRATDQCYSVMKDWVEQQGHAFLPLLDLVMSAPAEKAISPSHQCEHLIAVVEPVGISDDRVRVTLWAIASREAYLLDRTGEPFIYQEEIVFNELAAFIRDEHRCRFSMKPPPVVHLFVSPGWLHHEFDRQTCGKKARKRLGSEYPLVLRMIPPSQIYGYEATWEAEWKLLEQLLNKKAADVLKCIDCTDAEDAVAEIEDCRAAVLENCDDLEDLFDLIVDSDTALPVALWVRDRSMQAQVGNVLDRPLAKLKERIFEERKQAHKYKGNALLGHNLSLMWEDPVIVPPDLRFDLNDY